MDDSGMLDPGANDPMAREFQEQHPIGETTINIPGLEPIKRSPDAERVNQLYAESDAAWEEREANKTDLTRRGELAAQSNNLRDQAKPIEERMSQQAAALTEQLKAQLDEAKVNPSSPLHDPYRSLSYEDTKRTYRETAVRLERLNQALNSTGHRHGDFYQLLQERLKSQLTLGLLGKAFERQADAQRAAGVIDTDAIMLPSKALIDAHRIVAAETTQLSADNAPSNS